MKSFLVLLAASLLVFAGIRVAIGCNSPPCIVTGPVICSVTGATVKASALAPTVVCLDVAITNSQLVSGPAGCSSLGTAQVLVMYDPSQSTLPLGSTVVTNFGTPTFVPMSTTVIGKATVTLPPGTVAGTYTVKFVLVILNSPVMQTGMSCCGTICVSTDVLASPLVAPGFPSPLRCSIAGGIVEQGFNLTNCTNAARTYAFTIQSIQTSSVAVPGSGDNFPVSNCGVAPVGTTVGPAMLNGTITIPANSTSPVCFWSRSFPTCHPGSQCQYRIIIRDANTLAFLGCAELGMTVVSNGWNWGGPPTPPSFATVNPTVPEFRINGQIPAVAAPLTHNVPMNSGTLTLSLTEPSASRPFILATGILMPQAFPIPIGAGFLDLASPFALLDGIGLSTGPFDTFANTSFSVSATVAPPCSGYQSPGFQCVFFEPTAFPFPFGLSQAGAAVQPTSVTTTYSNTVTDDSFVTHNLACPMVYAGTTYTRVFLGSNGMVTLGAGSTDFSATNPEFFNGFRPATATGSNPGVAVMWGDYFRNTNTMDAIVVSESTGSVNIAYTGQTHWDSSSAAGNFGVTFDASDQVSIDLTGYIVGASSDTNRITGVTDGTNASGMDSVLDISVSQGGYVSSGPDSIMEAFPTGGSGLDLGIVNYVHLGGFQWLLL